jgi:hypothetical protein
MRLPWNRREPPAPGNVAAKSAASAQKGRWSLRALLPARHEAVLAHGPWLRLARDYLLARGAQLRAEETARIVADLPDGSHVAYTDTPDRAQDDTLLLVAGSTAAAQMIADIEAHSQIGAVRLAPAIDPVALAASYSLSSKDVSRSREEREDAAEGARRQNGLILHWEKPPARAVVSRSWEHASVEVEYRVAGRDHLGRIADISRVAIDLTSDAECAVLDPSRGANAQTAPLTPADCQMLNDVLVGLDERLRPGLEAAASFLRLRSETAYRQRIETISGVAERARRERPEEARQTDQALKREIAALDAVFAIDVECSVVAAWVIHTPMASVVYCLPGGSRIEVTLDLGRVTAVPLTCAGCQRATRKATICAHAHALCPSCRESIADPCTTCAPVVSPAGTAPLQRGGAQAGSGDGAQLAAGLTLERLARLSPVMWRTCVAWLLERQGYTLSAIASNEAEASWRGVDAKGHDVYMRALRDDSTQFVSQRDVAESARLARAQGLDSAIVMTTGSPTHAVSRAAETSNVRIIGRETLRAQFAALAESADRQQATVLVEANARARAAISTHGAMRKSLAAAAKRLDSSSVKPKAVGSATLAKASERLRMTRTAAEQAFLAWETLLADWLNAFGPAPAHDSSLPLLVDASEFQALRERASHLGTALADVLREMATTPNDGEMGYGAWRAAVVDEARLRCVALVAKLGMVDPAQWTDFDAARSLAREAGALEAENAARYASARADKAQSQVTQLAG